MTKVIHRLENNLKEVSMKLSNYLREFLITDHRSWVT